MANEIRVQTDGHRLIVMARHEHTNSDTKKTSSREFSRQVRRISYMLYLILSYISSRSFSVSTVWNVLPDYLRNPTLSIDVFKRYLKNVFIRSVLTRRYSALETLCLCAI